MRPNNPRIAILEAEQKFWGYSFCHLGRYKGRETKKQKRKAMIGDNECAQITPELLVWKPNRSLGVILSVSWADIKDEKQRSRKGRQGLGRRKAWQAKKPWTKNALRPHVFKEAKRQTWKTKPKNAQTKPTWKTLIRNPPSGGNR